MTALLSVSGLAKRFPIRRAGFDLLKPPQLLHAVEAVDFAIDAGEAVGLVGESGCGKSTLARMAARLIEPTAGKILLEGEDVTAQSASSFTASPNRRAIQMVFQDPTDSLNPRFSAADTIAEPLQLLGTLDAGATALAAGGATFPVALHSGFNGFNTPSTFRTFNRAIAARAASYYATSGGGTAAEQATGREGQPGEAGGHQRPRAGLRHGRPDVDVVDPEGPVRRGL